MPITAVLSFAGSYFSVLVAAVVLYRNKRSFVYWTFAAGMILLALEALLRGLGYSALLPQDVVYWQYLRFIALALLPGTWLVFSLIYARANYREFLARWKWVVLGVFITPTILASLFRDSLFAGSPFLGSSLNWSLPLGWSGRAFYLILLLSAILVLANLERTLRASTGRIRWQVKFMVLGVGGLFALQVYITSQALLFSSLDTGLGALHAVALLAANILFIRSLFRAQFLNVDFYVSRATIYSSLTLLIVGVYLLAVGFLAQVFHDFNRDRPLPLASFFVFLALTGLTILLLSDRLQQRLKRFVTRNFSRPHYDYRKEWMDSTRRTTSLVDAHELGAAVAKIVSETLDTLSVNIWLYDETQQRFALVGSTVFSRAEAKDLEKECRGVHELLDAMRDRSEPIDFLEMPFDWPEEIMRMKPAFFSDSKIRYGFPLQAGGELVGLMTLNDDRVGKEPLSLEDQDLLQAFAIQLAAGLLNLKLSDRLRKAKEAEVFQNVSAFFVHDLKNLASRLSMTMHNLPMHFDKPEFRADAVRAISLSLDKINEMCSRLSLLKEKVEPKMVATDLNELVKMTLDDLQISLKVPLERDLHSVAKGMIDPEQVQKVLVNLILNANEAINGGGTICVTTEQHNNQIVVSVSDNGRGMSEKFIEQSLFRPFQTTKKQGLGIGLFHSKLIVEAHHGVIEVESEQGKGSVFRVVLPAMQAQS